MTEATLLKKGNHCASTCVNLLWVDTVRMIAHLFSIKSATFRLPYKQSSHVLDQVLQNCFTITPSFAFLYIGKRSIDSQVWR